MDSLSLQNPARCFAVAACAGLGFFFFFLHPSRFLLQNDTFCLRVGDSPPLLRACWRTGATLLAGAALQIKLFDAGGSFAAVPGDRSRAFRGRSCPQERRASPPLPGPRMMYGAGVCNLGFAAVPGEMGGKRRVGNRVKRRREQGWHYPRRSQPEPAPSLRSLGSCIFHP